MQLGYRKLDFLFLWVSFVLFCISSWTYFLVHPKGELINELKTIVSRVLPTIISTTHSRISEISLKVSEIYVSVFCLLILTLWSSVSRCLKINSTSIHYSTLKVWGLMWFLWPYCLLKVEMNGLQLVDVCHEFSLYHID